MRLPAAMVVQVVIELCPEDAQEAVQAVVVCRPLSHMPLADASQQVHGQSVLLAQALVSPAQVFHVLVGQREGLVFLFAHSFVRAYEQKESAPHSHGLFTRAARGGLLGVNN